MPIPCTKPPVPSDDKRWKIVETRMRRLGDRPQALIEALHAAQEAFGFLETDALDYIGDTLGVPHSRVYGVATFYSFFTLKPQGEHTCVVCTGTACYINGAKEILGGLDRRLGVKPRETTPDGKVSLLTARCLGACSLAPAVIVDGVSRRRGSPVTSGRAGARGRRRRGRGDRGGARPCMRCRDFPERPPLCQQT
jgi:bidirectional [NiFe] hydrogenase diaphorase subunit